MENLLNQFLTGLGNTGWMEFIAVFAGILSVWYSKKENILVYPIGLINTTLYVYLSIKGQLFGEASVNLYYTLMSIYGWVLWTRKAQGQPSVHKLIITKSNHMDWWQQFLFFGVFYLTILFALLWAKSSFAPEAIPWADAFASATAFTGMWLMAKKKLESWLWWIATNLASIPLYFIKGYVFTSVQFMVLLCLAISGYFSWKQKLTTNQNIHG